MTACDAAWAGEGTPRCLAELLDMLERVDRDFSVRKTEVARTATDSLLLPGAAENLAPGRVQWGFKFRYGFSPSCSNSCAPKWQIQKIEITEHQISIQVTDATGAAKTLAIVANPITLSRLKRFTTPGPSLSFLSLRGAQKRQAADAVALELHRLESKGFSSALIDYFIEHPDETKNNSDQTLQMLRDLITLKQTGDYLDGAAATVPLQAFMDSPISYRWPGYKDSVRGEIRPIHQQDYFGLSTLVVNQGYLRAEDLISRDGAFELFLRRVDSEMHGGKPESEKSYGLSASFINGPSSSNLHYVSGKLLRDRLKKMGDTGGLKQTGDANVDQALRAFGFVPPQYANLPSQVRRYIRDAYRERLNISEGDLDQLVKISESLEERTNYIIGTKQPFADLEIGSENDTIRLKPLKKFDILGAISIVESSSAQEKLPLELFTDVVIERPKNGMVIEIGRFSVDPEYRNFLSRHLMSAAFLTAARRNVAKIVVEVEKSYGEELRAKFGFQLVRERRNFEGKTEYIMEVSPEVLFRQAFLAAP